MSSTLALRGGRRLRLLVVAATLICFDGVAAHRDQVQYNASDSEQNVSIAGCASSAWSMVKDAFRRLFGGNTYEDSEKAYEQEHEQRLAQLNEDYAQLHALEQTREQDKLARDKVTSQSALGPAFGHGFPSPAPLNSFTGDDNTSGSMTSMYNRHNGTATTWHGFLDYLLNLGDGTGATLSSRGTSALVNRALMRRMRYQDQAVVILLIVVYIGALFFTACVTYAQVANQSAVTYYADPRYSHACMTGGSTDNFLSSFTGPPENVQLQVSGLTPTPPMPDFLMESVVTWMGSLYRVDFSFALDLTPWLVPQSWGSTGGEPENQPDSGDEDTAVNPADIRELEYFLNHDTNDLAYIEVTKYVEWNGWEELSTNIKSKIRQGGYTGIINVRHTTEETVNVHKNKQWANFMHDRMATVLCALSLFGWMFYQPYMWVRHRSQSVRCKFRVDIPIDQYWQLIWDKIGPQGFSGATAGGFPPVAPSAGRNQRWETAHFT